MAFSSNWTAQVVDYTRRLGDYKETLSKLFPTLPTDVVNFRSIKDSDALVLALFLECYPHKVAVVELGTFVGVSTFHFASQPNVSRVLSVDPNPLISDEVSEASKVLDREFNPEPLPELRVLDIARATLAEFADESAKIEIQTGTVRSAWTGHQGDTFESSGKTEMSAIELTDGEPLLAFVDGAHTREAVEEDLSAIFESNPRAIAILDNCRRFWGPFVQAGVASFMERAQGKYHFQLFGDLSSGMATSNLGIVYSDVDSVEIQRSLAELSQLFSERLDPLWLASREQELIGVANAYKDEADSLRRQHEDLIGEYRRLADRKTGLQNRISQIEKHKSRLEAQIEARNSQLEKRNSHLEKRNSQLQERNSQLEEHKSRLEERKSQLEKRKSQLEERNSQLEQDKLVLNSQLGVYRASRRYRVADAVAENVIRIPGARALARRDRQEQ